jgi:hypothetical protein
MNLQLRIFIGRGELECNAVLIWMHYTLPQSLH